MISFLLSITTPSYSSALLFMLSVIGVEITERREVLDFSLISFGLSEVAADI